MSDYGEMFSGLATLATIGLIAIFVAVPAGVVAAACLFFWAWHHVSVAIQ